MSRFNWRLICSVLSVGAIALVGIYPPTRELLKRDVWRIKGEYQDRFNGAVSRGSSYLESDVVESLLSYDSTVDLARRYARLVNRAKQREDPALFALAVGQAPRFYVQFMGDELQPISESTRTLSGDTVMYAATEGAKLEPDNGFFVLAKAIAHGLKGDLEQAKVQIIRASKMARYDSHWREIEGHLRSLKEARMGRLLRSEQSAAMSFGFAYDLPALTLIDQMEAISHDRMRLGLAFARIALMINRDQARSGLFNIGPVMLRSSIGYTTRANLGQRSDARFARQNMAKITEMAHTTGDRELIRGWEEIEREAPNLLVPERRFGPTFSSTPQPIAGLIALAAILVVGGALWMLSHYEPERRSVGMLAFGMSANGAVAATHVEHWAMLAGALAGSGLLLAAFLSYRLPGKGTQSVVFAIFGIVAAFAGGWLAGNYFVPAALVGLWVVPFLASQWVETRLPGWICLLLVLAVETAVAYVWAESWRLIEGNEAARSSKLLSGLAIAGFWIPMGLAYLMATAKVRFGDAARMALAPLPVLALGVSIWTVWQYRVNLQVEQAWEQYFEGRM